MSLQEREQSQRQAACQKRWLWTAVAAAVAVVPFAVWGFSLLERQLPAGVQVPIARAAPGPGLPSDDLLAQLRADNPKATISSCRVKPDALEWQPHEVEIHAKGLQNLTALRQVRGLHRLTIVDPLWTDLSSLRGLGIAELDVARTGVVDLGPIRRLGLEKLELRSPEGPWLFQTADTLVDFPLLKVNNGKSWDFYGDYDATHRIPPPREIVTLPPPRVVEVEKLPPPRTVEP